MKSFIKWYNAPCKDWKDHNVKMLVTWVAAVITLSSSYGVGYYLGTR